MPKIIIDEELITVFQVSVLDANKPQSVLEQIFEELGFHIEVSEETLTHWAKIQKEWEAFQSELFQLIPKTE